MLRIQALNKPQLAHMLAHTLDAASGLPVVLNAEGPWMVTWGDYPLLTIELDCCRYSFPTLSALPSENYRCPHGNWVVQYVS